MTMDIRPVERGRGRGQRGRFPPGVTTFGGPAVAKKYKVHQNAPFKKQNF